MIVRELITRFGFNVDQTGVNRVEGSINRLSGMLSGLAAFASLRALSRVADSMQSLEARIGMLPQTIGDVGAAFNEVSKNATDNRQSLDAYGTLYARIGNAAKEYINTQKDLITVSNTISQALVVGGATTQEAASVMVQFSQALGAGTLQGEEFRAMAEAAPQYMDALAEALGYPRSELKKLASEGKITSKSVIEATLKMSTMFQEKFRQMPMTVGAATTIIGNKFKTMIAGLNRESQVVTKIANFFLDGFDKIENGAKSFIKFVGGSTNALKTFGIALAAILGPAALGGLIAALGTIFSVAGLVVAGLILLGLAIDDIITYLNGGDSAFGSFIQWLKSSSLSASIFKAIIVALGGAFAAFGVIAVFTWGSIAAAALSSAVKIAASWLIAMGPVGWVIAAIIGIGTAIYALWDNWDLVTGWMGDKINWLINKLKSLAQYMPDFGDANMAINSAIISPAEMAGSMAGSNTNVTSTQVVNLTVPAGTPESQQAFLLNAASVLKSDGADKKMARDMATGGW